MQKKDKIELTITVVLSLLLLFSVINGVNKAKKKHNVEKNKLIKKQIIMSKQNERVKGLFLRLEEAAGNLELKRDPFTPAPLIPNKRYPHGLRLNGIVWDILNPAAVINGNILKVGDIAGDSKVINIGPDKVILNDGYSDFEIRIE